MRRIAKFMKVSREEFLKDYMDAFPECSKEKAEAIYEGILSLIHI